MTIIPVNNGYLIWMEESLYKMYSANKQIVLRCDINIDLLSNKSHTLNTSWVNTTANMELNQIIKDPTRIAKYANTLIDHIYVSKDLPVIQSMLVEYSVSDHYPAVYAVIDLKNNITWCANDTHKTIHYRKYTHFKSNYYLKDLKNSD